jgi:predicted small metal-binding protein
MTDERLDGAGATLTTRCVCGWERTGPEAEVVEATIDHGRRVHNMVATAEEVLAQAQRNPAPA